METKDIIDLWGKGAAFLCGSLASGWVINCAWKAAQSGLYGEAIGNTAVATVLSGASLAYGYSLFKGLYNVAQNG